MPEKQALEDAGETDENDEDEEIDKVRRKAGYFLLHVYTCQLFLEYRHEIFILGVLGFLKTTRSFPNIPKEVRSLQKKSEVFQRRPSVT